MRRCCCFIVPPHMLAEIVQRADNHAERRRAMNTLNATNQMVGTRSVMSLMPMSMAVRVPGVKYRMVYDARHRQSLPGSIARREAQPATHDHAIDEAYDGAGTTYDFYRSVFGRASLDNRGLILSCTSHFGKYYDNAFWNGSQLVFGDGDERHFQRFTSCLDVIAHELAHGVTQYTSGLEYQDQPGILNEHLSDVFGILTKQWALGQDTAASSWMIGEGIFGSEVQGQGLRSMKAPGTAYDDPMLGKDPQPAHMKDYVHTDEDNGGVHINSGIPNYAFYLAAVGIGGRAWEKPGRIWYEVASKKLWASANLQDMANLTYHTAGELFGDGGTEQRVVADAWNQVGIAAA